MKKFIAAVVGLMIVNIFAISICSALSVTGAEKVLAPSLVDVICPLEYDQHGEVPKSAGIYCAACNTFHDGNLEKLVRNGRDLKFTGFLVSEREVIAPDLLIGNSGMGSVLVSHQGEKVKASVKNIYPEHGALMLELEKPLKTAKPLNIKIFNAQDDRELYTFSRMVEEGCFVQRLERFSPQQNEQLFNGSRLSRSIPGNCVVLNKSGEVVAIMGNTNETLKESFWYTPYTTWKSISAADFLQNCEKLRTHLQSTVLPAAVYFNEWTLSRREKLMGITPVREIRSFVFRLPDGKVIMPVLLTPREISLIEKVTVDFQGRQVNARVVAELRHFGCMVLELPPEVNLPPVAPRCQPLDSELGLVVWSVEINSYADGVDIAVFSDILGAVVTGFRNNLCGVNLKKQLVPDLLFDLNGDLLGINLDVRAFNYERIWPVVNACDVVKMLAAPAEVIPCSKHRMSPDAVGFLGVEYQSMNRDLARSMKLERETNNGAIGLLVSYVYPGSLAEKMKIKVGDVLLKIILPDGGAPVVLSGENFGMAQERQFPWENLDALPEMYFSEIPEPWTGVKTRLSNQLTNIGIGNDFILTVASNGSITKRRAAVESAPEYFEIAPAYRSSSFGLEVRNITFEVARYFRIEKGAAGVIVSEVDAGSSASTAGLRPFEIITAVNDKPVHNAGDFKKALAGCSEVSLAVRRLAANRVVTLKPKNAEGSVKQQPAVGPLKK